MKNTIFIGFFCSWLLTSCTSQKESEKETLLELSRFSQKSVNLVHNRSIGVQNSGKLKDSSGLKVIPLSGVVESKIDALVGFKPQNIDLLSRRELKPKKIRSLPGFCLSSYPDGKFSNELNLKNDFYTQSDSIVSDLSSNLHSENDVFSYVKYNVENRNFFGATQSASLTSRLGSGTVVDKANLLVSLFRYRNVPSYFVFGGIYLNPEASKLFFRSAGDVYIPNLILNLYTQYFTNFASHDDVVAEIDGKTKYLVPHVWVRAQINGVWKTFDPTRIPDGVIRNSSQNLLKKDFLPDWDKWFFRKNKNQEIVKSQTVMDYLFQSSQTNPDIDFSNSSPDITELNSSDEVMGNQPCIFGAYEKIENSIFEHRVQIYVKNLNGETKIDALLPLARVSENQAFLKHDAGIISEIISPTTGYERLLVGSEEVGKFWSRTGDDYSLEIQPKLPDFTLQGGGIPYSLYPSPFKAGSPFFINAFARPIHSSELTEILEKTKRDVEAGANSTTLMADSHRAAGLLYQYKLAKSYSDEEKLRGIQTGYVSVFTTNTDNGKIVTSGNEDREFGFVPTRPWIRAGGYEFFSFGNSSYGDNQNEDLGNTRSYRFEIFIESLNNIAVVWEDLFGLRGRSPVRDMQIAMKVQDEQVGFDFAPVPGLYFDGSGSTHIQNLLKNPSFLRGTAWPGIVANYDNPGCQYWGVNQEVADTEPGIVAVSYIIDCQKRTPPFNTLTSMFAYLSPPPFLPNARYLESSRDEDRPSSLLSKVINAAASYFIKAQSNEKENKILSDSEGTSFSDRALQPNQGIDLSVGPENVGGPTAPVEVSTGLASFKYGDISIRGKTKNTGLNLTRIYYSVSNFQKSSGWVATGDFGAGWIHSYDTRLLNGCKVDGCDGTEDDAKNELQMGALTGAADEPIVWVTETGSFVRFTKVSGAYKSENEGAQVKLEIVGSTYVITKLGNVKYVFKKDISSNYNGRLINLIDPHGDQLVLTYSVPGKLTKVTSSFAGDLDFQRDGSGRLTSVTNSKNGLSVEYTYSGQKLSSAKDLTGHTYLFKYNSNSNQVGTKAEGLLEQVVDPLGRVNKIEYYKNGKVFKNINSNGNQTIFRYSPYLFQKLTTVTWPNGSTSEFRYDSSFQQVLVVAPDGSRKFWNWDSKSHITSTVDELGYQTKFIYDAQGNVISRMLPESKKFGLLTYDPTFNVPLSMQPAIGSRIDFEIDQSNGDLISKRTKSDGVNIFEKYSYDQYGTRVSVQNNYSSYSDYVNSDSLVITSFDSKNPTRKKYDTRGRIIEQAFKNGRIIKMSYNNLDNITHLEDSHGPDLSYEYDELNRVKRIIRNSSLGREISSREYDMLGRIISENDFSGRTTRYEYFAVNDGPVLLDRPKRIINAEGKQTSFEYDKIGRKTREVSPNGEVTLYRYNLRGDLVATIDNSGLSSQFWYDGNRRLVKIVNQSVGVRQSNTGTLEVGFLPEITVLTYDDLNRLVRKDKLLANESAISGALRTTYEYDDLSRLARKRHLHVRGEQQVSEKDDISVSYYSLFDDSMIKKVSNKYVNLGFQYEMTPPFNLLAFSREPTLAGADINIDRTEFEIIPDMNGPMRTLISNGKNIVSQKYDLNGGIAEVKAIWGGNEGSLSVGYDGLNRKNSISASDGTEGSFANNSFDRAQSINWSGGSTSNSFSYQYGSNGFVNSLTREFGSFSYRYDKNDQIVNANYVGSLDLSNFKQSVVYDSNGNIESYGSSYSNKNNFTTEYDGWIAFPSSDGLGRLEYRRKFNNGLSLWEFQKFEYFNEGQLSKVYSGTEGQLPTKVAEYYYDGLGRRIAKVVRVAGSDDTVATFTHLGADDRILISNLKKGASISSVLYIDGNLPDEHLFEISTSSGVKIYRTDGIGSVVNAIATGGKGTYGLFGENVGTSVSSSELTEPVTYGFTGREYDVETGLYFYRDRYYDPFAGKFLSRDSIDRRMGGDIHPYRYVGNNPLNYVDPNGRFGFIAILVASFLFTVYENQKEGGGFINQWAKNFVIAYAINWGASYFTGVDSAAAAGETFGGTIGYAAQSAWWAIGTDMVATGLADKGWVGHDTFVIGFGIARGGYGFLSSSGESSGGGNNRNTNNRYSSKQATVVNTYSERPRVPIN